MRRYSGDYVLTTRCSGEEVMKIGVYMFPTEYAMPLVDLAVALEERGFESLFVPEHTHIPSGRQTPWPRRGDLPKAVSYTHLTLPTISRVRALPRGACAPI